MDSELLGIDVELVNIFVIVDHIFFNASPLISFEDTIGDMPAFRLVNQLEKGAGSRVGVKIIALQNLLMCSQKRKSLYYSKDEVIMREFLKQLLINLAFLVGIGILLLLVAPDIMKQVYEMLGACLVPWQS